MQRIQPFQYLNLDETNEVGDKDPGKEKVIVAIYLEAEDFEAMKKVTKPPIDIVKVYFFTKVGRVVRSQYIVNAIKHFNELYQSPTFLIRSVKKVYGVIHDHMIINYMIPL